LQLKVATTQFAPFFKQHLEHSTETEVNAAAYAGEHGECVRRANDRAFSPILTNTSIDRGLPG
jgi:hypothetical protein